ncbi:MAG: hypothetical protein J0M12_08970 [Deltaproteobacteria bacterium]|nr:hypothetical protein [Deltaproteobacteria bacterium]
MSSSKSALDTLVSGLFDFAGMFPPASLSFDDALVASSTFAHDLKRPFLVAADMVVGIEHLSRVRPELLHRLGFSTHKPFRIAVLGTPLSGSSDLSRSSELDLILQCNREDLQDAVKRQVLSYELKLTPAIQADSQALLESVRAIQLHLNSAPVKIFLEPDLSVPQWHAVLDIVCGVIKLINEESDSSRIGLKIRGSGPTAVSAAKLATIVQEVASAQLHFKATAGLHHPIVERSRYHNELGFLNLCCALFLRRQLGSAFPEKEVLACLSCERSSDFELNATGLRWKSYHLNIPMIEELKANFHFSIGSCSLLEPDQDLLRLFD